MTVKQLTNSEREQMFLRARAINSNLGNIFQNPLWLNSKMIDDEFDSIDSFQHEINSYRKQLNSLKDEK